ncbi:MAG TPA: lipopolysaccharide heptosyltransferase I [Thermoanaerobaculia bacterium]|jgi:lipopolysaccharide heptosyltransferase I
MTSPPRRLLVVRLSALGDVIHTIPAVVALRDALPKTQIVWAVEAPYRELVEIVTGVQSIPVRMKRWGREPLASRRDAMHALRAMRQCDAAVDFQGLIKSAVLVRLSGAKTRYGFAKEAIREKPAAWFTNRHVKVDTTKHVIEQNLQLASGVLPLPRKAGLEAGTARWDAFPADPEGKLAESRNAIVLLPGAGKPNKLWPIGRFRELAKNLGDRALAVWGPGERDLAHAIGCRIAPPTDLRELAWLLRHAKAVIGADTGPLHLAVALGTRVIGLYGPTDPRRNGPYGQLEQCVNEFDRTKLMTAISVQDVMTTLDRVGVA